MKKAIRWALPLFCLPALLGGALPQPPETFSPRVLRAETALATWMAEGAKDRPALMAPLDRAVRGLPAPGMALAPGQEPALRLLVRTQDPAALRAAGFAVRTVAGEVVTMTSPLSRLRELGALPGVTYVDLPMPLKPMLDISSTVAHANFETTHGSAVPPYPGITGAGVVVGLIDSGIDYTHDDFKNGDGTTRITKIWDQNDAGGPNPASFNYGTEWNSTAINNNTARQIDGSGHGTHVAGIAVGNGRATDIVANQYTYVGVAPEAEIYAVNASFLEDDLIDGVNWIQTNAAPKPTVVNMSLGGQFGSHDGESNLDVAMRGLSGPGRILVAAAGNEGKADLHAENILGPNGMAELQLSVGTYTAKSGSANDVLFVEQWYQINGNLRVTVTTPTGLTVGPVTTNQSITVPTADGAVDLGIFAGPAGDSRFVEVVLWDQVAATPPRFGTWKIKLENMSGAANLEVDSWIAFNFLGNVASAAWLNFIDDQEMVASPASSDSVIAVGAYVSKTAWPSAAGGTCRYNPAPAIGDIAPFSSDGPLRDGTQKPEISAPGMGIASAKSKDATGGFADGCATTTDNVHVTSQGTSQATPHVAGAAALILQTSPTASYREVTDRLITTAKEDVFTGMGFSTEFGHGKLDVNAAVNTVVPVRFLQLAAAWEDGRARVRWSLAETEPGALFHVERAAHEEGPFAPVSDALNGALEFVWEDPAPLNQPAWYRVRSTTRTGAVEHFGPVPLGAVEPAWRLWQNAPNPFVASTSIRFALAKPGPVQLEVLDVTGRRVATLVEGTLEPGLNQSTWDGRDAVGRPAAAGIYFYRLTTPEKVLTRRLVLVR